VWSAFVTILAIAVASNLDNAGVGIAYGVRRIHISWTANLMIALISGGATFVSGFVGDTVTRYVSSTVADLTGAIVVILVGIWVMTDPWRTARRVRHSPNVMTRILRDPAVADFDNSQTISMKEAVVLGIALAMNALAGGFDAGVANIGIVLTSIFVAGFSYILLGVSAFLGRRYAAQTLGDKATYIAGLLLILIGIHQIW